MLPVIIKPWCSKDENGFVVYWARHSPFILQLLRKARLGGLRLHHHLDEVFLSVPIALEAILSAFHLIKTPNSTSRTKSFVIYLFNVSFSKPFAFTEIHLHVFWVLLFIFLCLKCFPCFTQPRLSFLIAFLATLPLKLQPSYLLVCVAITVTEYRAWCEASFLGFFSAGKVMPILVTLWFLWLLEPKR